MRVQKPKKIKRSALEKTRTVLGEKIRESAVSVLPILVIVVILCLCIVPMRTDLLLTFLIGALLLTVGMGLFSLGAEQSMTLIGSRIGTALTKTKNLPLILGVSFLLGFAITVAEPDLQVLASTVPHIEKTVLLAVVGAGVGLFMSLCMVRILYGIRLRWVLLVCYAIVFALAAFTDKNFLSIAFDSGGVTTGPMTVPFILALGLGVSNIRSDSGAKADSFGLVALCSIGPILAVLILGLFYRDSSGVAELTEVSYASTTVIGSAFLGAIPVYLKEMAVAMLPIVGIFLIFQLAMFRMNRRSFWKIMVGILYTYVGLVLFLTGVNVGFSSLGAELGAALAEGDRSWLLIPLAALLGWFIISAARRWRARKADRGRERRRYPRQNDQGQPLRGDRARHGVFHAARCDRHFAFVVHRAGLRARADPLVLRAGHLHCHRVRLRRRRLRPHDGDIYAPVYDGHEHRSRRRRAARRLRRCGAGRHDAAAFDPGRRLLL